MTLFLESFPVGPIEANCTLLGDTESGEAAVIDPGADAPVILERVDRAGLRVTMILHTHGHFDHAGGTADLAAALGPEVPIGLHRDELEIYEALPTQGAMFGMTATPPPKPTLWLEDGMRLEIGSIELEVRHAPGHSPGSVCLIAADLTPPIAVVGDVLFAGSIGRTDLWGGSFPVLERSIREKLYTLPDETRVVCGHGPETTIGREKAGNPFVRAEE